MDFRISLSIPTSSSPSFPFISEGGNLVICWACNPKDQLLATKWPWVNLREISQEKGLTVSVWVQCWEEWRESASGTIPWNPMASWCKKCGPQDPRHLPYTSVRITEAEMRAYHHFLESCTRLECMATKGTVRAIMLFFYVHFFI